MKILIRKAVLTQLLMAGSIIGYAQKGQRMDAQSKLGDVCTLHYGVSDLDKAISFYQQLNYKVLSSQENKTLISDGTVLIYLQKGNEGRQELAYYSDDPGSIAAKLKAEGMQLNENPKDVYQIKTTEGFVINLMKKANDVQKPTGKNLITMSPADHRDASKYPNPKCGAFGEYSLPVSNLDASITFWEKLGYKSAMKQMQPYPHAILTDGSFIIGLHENPEFTAPGLTYFCTNMSERIKKLKSEGFKEGKAIDANNEVFMSPDGYAVFLFGL